MSVIPRPRGGVGTRPRYNGMNGMMMKGFRGRSGGNYGQMSRMGGYPSMGGLGPVGSSIVCPTCCSSLSGGLLEDSGPGFMGYPSPGPLVVQQPPPMMPLPSGPIILQQPVPIPGPWDGFRGFGAKRLPTCFLCRVIPRYRLLLVS